MTTTQVLRRSLQNTDDLVVAFKYRDSKGQQTQRVVSPIRLLGGNRFLGLCLTREQPRQFYLERCDDMQLAAAADFVMPLPEMAISG